jgi:arsenate reductase
METQTAVPILAALAQPTRLDVVRLLVSAGPNGRAAGEIAARLRVLPSTLSFHLKELDRSGLLRAWRDGRQIRYAIEFEAMRGLLTFLTADCCGGQPELCGDLTSLGTAWGRATLEDPSMPDRQMNVLFLCSGNSARSIMAECALNRWGVGRFKAYSAGSHPRGYVHPVALDVLRTLNYDVATLRSKDWEEFARADAPALDFVFTVCDRVAGEVCPVGPGQPMTAHWGIEDPAEFVGPPAKVFNYFMRIYSFIDNRVKIFSALRLEDLDKLSLQKRLDEIGRIRGEVPILETA